MLAVERGDSKGGVVVSSSEINFAITDDIYK
jgi:hypothetical protein